MGKCLAHRFGMTWLAPSGREVSARAGTAGGHPGGGG